MIGALAMNCASYGNAELAGPQVSQELIKIRQNPKDRSERIKAQSAIEPGQVAAVVPRFTAWGYHERYLEGMRDRLQLRGYRLRSEGPDLLEIVLEESGSTPGGLKFLNFIATIVSGTLIPYHNQVNYHLTYRHFRNGELRSTCRYELRNNEFVGALMIPLIPFRWPTSVLSEILTRTVDAYSYGCVALENLPVQ